MINSSKEYWVTIAVPVYNVENYLERCARSLFDQTYSNIRYFFVNDGSSDGSFEVLTRIIEEYPHRKPYVSLFSFPENRGLAAVRNHLVDHCTTDWIIHVDADDWIEHDLVAHLVERQQETNADIVISNFFKHGNGHIRKYVFKDYVKKTDFLKLFLSDIEAHNIWGRLIRRSLYVDHSVHVATDCIVAEDLRAFIRLAYFANQIAVLNEFGYHYEIQRKDRITVKNSGNLRKKGYGILASLSDVRSFVAEKMPEYLVYYETSISRYCYEEYIYLSIQYSERELFKVMSKNHKELVCKYPFLCSGFRDNIKRYLKYNYCFCRTIMRLKKYRFLHHN